MDYLNPVYSEETECQDCYKCIRECPVKAIRVTNNRASIIPELCMACGHCVNICPSGAKKVRDDLKRVKHLLERTEKVIVSLAPSFRSEFNGLAPEKLIHAIKRLGFYGVSETALGAQQISAQLAADIETPAHQTGIMISSACPVAVEFISRYYPEHAGKITNLLSPLLAHCRFLKSTYGEGVGIVFVGPCIAKKLEERAHPELLDVSITFEDLRRWFEKAQIVPNSQNPTPDDFFIPEAAQEGALYPVEGGMIEATKLNCKNNDVRFMGLSGIKNIEEALQNLDEGSLHENILLELLACEGGCVNGPKSSRRSVIQSRLDVMEHADVTGQNCPRNPSVDVRDDIRIEPVTSYGCTEEEITDTLQKIGKQVSADELNCSGCGYHSCRELAVAIIAGKAETSMCVSYMRQQAQKKANALLRTLPYAVVIADKDLKIIECNGEFVRMGGEDVALISEVVPGLEGADLSSIFPFCDLFRMVLETGEDIVRRYIRFNDTVLSATIFTIDLHQIVGATLVDVTHTELHREQIVEKAQQVIQNTLTSVQDIAFRLGKSAAESELILNSIIEGFSVTRYPDDRKE